MRIPFTPRRESDRRVVSSQSRGSMLVDADSSLSPVEIFVWLEGGSVVVSWRVREGADAGWEGSTWSLERSSSPYGPFVAWVKGLRLDARECRDDSHTAARLNTRWVFYRLVRVRGDERETFGLETWDQDSSRADEVPGVTWGALGVSSHEVPAVVRETRRRFIAVLTSFLGTPALLYRESWLNPADMKVVDTRTGILRTSGNPEGVGTVFEGGYDRPIPITVNAGLTAQSLALSASIPVDLLQSETVEVAHWPAPQISDRLRFFTGRIFEITQIMPQQLHGHVISYMVAVDELAPDHPLNSLPLPASFREEARFPRRQAARAANPEAYARSLSLGAGARASTLPPDAPPGEEDR